MSYISTRQIKMIFLGKDQKYKKKISLEFLGWQYFLKFLQPSLSPGFFKKVMGILWMPLSICPFYLILNHGGISLNLLHEFPPGKGVPEQHYFSIQHPACSICQSPTSSQTTGQNLTKLTTWLPFMVRVSQSESVHLALHHAISNISTEHGDLRWRVNDYSSIWIDGEDNTTFSMLEKNIVDISK